MILCDFVFTMGDKMTGSVAIDILIGLFTLYFVMSTLSSAIVELISSVLALRSKMLLNFLEYQFYRTNYHDKWKWIESIKNIRENRKFALDPHKFYQIQGAKMPAALEIIQFKEKLLPSIKSENFAQALNVLIGFTEDVEVVIPVNKKREIENFNSIVQKSIDPKTTNVDLAGVVDELDKAKKDIDTELMEIKNEKGANERKSLLAELQKNLDTHVTNLDPLVAKLSNIDAITKAYDDLKKSFKAIDKIGTNPVDASIEDLKIIVNSLPPSRIKDVLINAIQQTGTNIKDVSAHVAQWFDGEMERISEIYRRRAQLFLFIVGLVVAVVLNVNTIDIADALAKNPSLREAVLQQEKTLITSSDPTKLSVEQALDQLNEMSLPIGRGRECSPTLDPTSANPKMPCPPSKDSIAIEVLGIFITAAAVALGAPFWFDLLKSVTARADSSKADAQTKGNT
jgi:hypothetical protein